MEQQILVATDSVAPIVELTGNQASNTIKLLQHIKRKLNLQKKLLRRLKQTQDNAARIIIKNLNHEIKQHYTTQKRNKVNQLLNVKNQAKLHNKQTHMHQQ